MKDQRGHGSDRRGAGGRGGDDRLAARALAQGHPKSAQVPLHPSISQADLETASRVLGLMREGTIAQHQSEQGADWLPGAVIPKATLDVDRKAAPVTKD